MIRASAGVVDWDRTWALPRDEEAMDLGPGLLFERVSSREPELWRWTSSQGPRLVRLPPGRLRLVPVLPAEPLVLRFLAPLDLTPGAGLALVFAGLPVNVQVEHVPETERGQPSVVAQSFSPGLRRRLAAGRVEAPSLARAVDTGLHAAPGDVAPGLAVLPLRFRLSEDALRTLDRIMLPAGGLSLWAGGEVLCASAVEVDPRDPEEVEVRILAEVPRADVTLRSGPPPSTGEFSLRGLVRALTQITFGAE